MTLITFQDGQPVMRDGKVGTGQGCCCGGCGAPCSRCNQSCLSLTIEGFAGPTGQQCSECDGVNGTYTLSRGTGAPPSMRAFIQDTTGTGAVIAATLGYQPSDGSYTITKASINKKGTCYTKNAAFAYTLDGASVACDDEPAVTVEVERTEPLLNFGAIDDRFAPLGAGASLQPSFTPVATTTGAQTWGISSVSVTAGGTNYDDYSPISIKAKGCTVTIRPAVASIRTPRDQPIETAVFVDSKTGSGAVLDLQWEEVSLPENQYHPAGAVAWRATGATILSGGSGYTVDDVVKYTLDSSHRYASGSPDPTILAQGSLTIPLYGLAFSNIGPGGSLVGVIGTDWPFDLTNDTLFWYRGNNGAIQSVTVADGGEYYTPEGIASLTIQDGGTFWPDEPCNYGYCGPSACKVNGETQCRQLSVNIGNNDRKLTISSDSGVLIQATVPADGYPCDGITFASKEITSSCATVGTITLAGATCSGPSQDSCCRECSRCIRNGEWDCQYTTQETCEDCTRTYTCDEARQTECDGDCPAGFTPGEPVRVVASQTPGCGNWTGYGTTAAYGIATVGCGQILSVALDPEYHDGLGPPTGFARLGRVAPTITATVTQSGGSASGAVLAVELGESTDDCGLPYWFISGISVVSPGSGYTIFEPSGNAEITIAAAPGDIDLGYSPTIAYVWDVDENGGILSVYLSSSSQWYRNSTTAPPILTPVTVTIDNEGSGAVVTPVVDTNTSSPTFGHITGFSVANGGSGYVSLCSRNGPVASCEECPPRSYPEYAFCITNVADDGKPCGTWTPGFPCVEPPCCDSCLVLPNPPWPSSPTRTCVPTLNVEENTSDYEKSSSISSGPPEWYGALPWAEGWLDEHDSCTLVWVEDFVIQTNETGTYCQDYVWPGSPGWGGGNFPDGYTSFSPYCYIHSIVPGWLYCRGYAKKYWTRFRLFLVDCRDRSISEVTDAALAGPVEFSGCIVDVGVPIGAAQNEARPLCDPPNCNGANPGFLDAQPTLECAE